MIAEFGISRRGLLRLGGLMVAGAILDACGAPRPVSTPSSQATPSIEDFGLTPGEREARAHGIANRFKNAYPECIVRDVNQELTDLAAGKDTLTPKYLPSKQEARAVVQTVLDNNRKVLQVRARAIIDGTSDPKSRSYQLAEFYSKTADLEGQFLDMIKGEEEEEAIRYLVGCHLTKDVSLIEPYTTEDLNPQKPIK